MAVYQMTFSSMKEPVDRGFLRDYSNWSSPGRGNLTRVASNQYAMFKENLDSCRDYFIFIIAKYQQEEWQKFMKDYEMEQYLHWEMPCMVTNHVHEGVGRALKVYIFKGKGKAK